MLLVSHHHMFAVCLPFVLFLQLRLLSHIVVSVYSRHVAMLNVSYC